MNVQFAGKLILQQFDQRTKRMAMEMSYVMSSLGFITLIRGFLPPELKDIVQKWWDKLIQPVNPFCNFFVPENGASGSMNNLYRVVEMHLSAANLCRGADQLSLYGKEKRKEITYNLAGMSTQL